MSILTHSYRRTVLAGLAITAITLPAIALSQPALAAAAKADTAKVDTVERSVPGVTSEAWAAGRAAKGTRATASDAVTAFWTAKRMKTATKVEDSPVYLAAVERYEKTKMSKSAQEDAARNEDGKPASFEGRVGRELGQPKGDLAATGAKSGKGAKSGLRAAAIYPGLPYYHPTARTSGKVFFSMGGGNYSCSGTIVNSEGLDTVWTAGHCVNPGGGGAWATNWQFVPSYNAYAANPAPYGTWTANQLWAMNSWSQGTDFTSDMGVAIMNMKYGYHIVNYLGGQGLRVNMGKNLYENAFGYPSEAPYSGGTLYRCAGWSSPEWSNIFTSSDTIKIPCDMTRGSSGGGWLYAWDGNWGYLNGVNSRIDRIVGPTIMLSPYFDNTALTLYNATRYL